MLFNNELNVIEKTFLETCKELESLCPKDAQYTVLNVVTEDSLVEHEMYSQFGKTFPINESLLVPIMLRRGIIRAHLAGCWGWSTKVPCFNDQATTLFRDIEARNLEIEEVVGSILKTDIGLIDLNNKTIGGIGLFDVNKIREVISIYSNLAPQYNEEEQALEFLGRKVKFSRGDLSNLVKVLTNNLNGFVSVEDFYNARGDAVSYRYYVNQHSKGEAGVKDMLKKQFDEIKNKLKSDNVLKDIIHLQMKNGFGMFVDQTKYKTYLDDLVQ